MINKYGCFVVLGLFILGCAHTHRSHKKPLAEYYDQINGAADAREGRIVLVSGESFQAGKFRVTSDSTSWITIGTWKKQTVPTTAVKEIVVKNSTQGAAEGSLIRGVSALVLVPVFFMIWLSGDDLEGNGSEGPGLFSVASGPLIGLIAGMVITHRDKFMMPDSAAAFNQKSKSPKNIK